MSMGAKERCGEGGADGSAHDQGIEVSTES